MKATTGAVVIGGTSLAYKTGSWRDMKPVIEMELCRLCGICSDVCPDNSVYVEHDQYFIDYDYCKGCGLCAFECPSRAISMVKEEK
jgi:2-oxoacid:acceptor oxidoreductase delta subunit (pyruvate/2-ketoisovalerate family)